MSDATPPSSVLQATALHSIHNHGRLVEIGEAPKLREGPLTNVSNRESTKEKEETPVLRVYDEEGADHLEANIVQEGVDAFNRFENEIKALDDQLQSFISNVQQLGSSSRILFSTYELRTQLARVLYAFRENARVLFGKEAIPQKEPPHVRKYRLSPFQLDREAPEMMPQGLKDLATILDRFCKDLNMFPDFEGVFDAPALSFRESLEDWASRLRESEDQLRHTLIRLWVNEATSDLRVHVPNITAALMTFIKVGIPAVQMNQKETNEGLLNLSTVATFFSAVTATTLQYGYQDEDTSHLKDAVNLLWLVSLVFSIGSAINSQLAYYWRSATSRSPRVPWLVSMWITGTPLAFLIASAIAFSAGLACFSFARFPGSIAIATAVATSISSFAFFTVGLWLIGEHYAFSHTNGEKWLAEIGLGDLVSTAKLYSGWDLLKRFRDPFDQFFCWTGGMVCNVQTCLGQLYGSTLDLLGGLSDIGWRGRPGHSSPEPILPVSSPLSTKPTPAAAAVAVMQPMAPENDKHHLDTTVLTQYSVTKNAEKAGPASEVASDREHLDNEPLAEATAILETSKVKQSGLGEKTTSAAAFPSSKSPIETDASGSSNPAHPSPRHSSSLPIPSPPVSTSNPAQSSLDPNPQRQTVHDLKMLKSSQYLGGHAALVTHLQFSPDGRWLATCSGGETVLIYKFGDKFDVHHKLSHPKAFVSRVAWGSDGQLLTKSIRAITLWNAETGVCERTMTRKQDVQSIAWMPKRCAFVSVEGSRIYIINLTGHVEEEHDLSGLYNLQLRDIIFTPDEKRILAMARRLNPYRHGLSQESAQAALPHSRWEWNYFNRRSKIVLVFNLESKSIKNECEVDHEVQDITMSSDGNVALVTYEHDAPAQLFRLDVTDNAAKLILQKTYAQPTDVKLAGGSALGQLNGNDHLVLCTGKARKAGETKETEETEETPEIHIWDRVTGKHLHPLRNEDEYSHLSSIAWNRALTSRLMIASGHHDGSIWIWTTPTPKISDAIEEPGRDGDRPLAEGPVATVS